MKKHFSKAISFLLIISLLIFSSISVVSAVQDSTAIPIAYILTDGTINYRVQYDQLLTSYISYRKTPDAPAARLAKFYFDTLNNDIAGLIAYQSGNTLKYVNYSDILSKYVSTRNIDTTYIWFNSDSATSAFSALTEVKSVGSDGVISGRFFVDGSGLAVIFKTDLDSAINSAKTNIGTAVVSADGTDIDTTDIWVSQPVMTAYSDAISAAQAVADNPDATQQKVDDALAAINSATNSFNAAKTNGTNIPVIEINVTGETTVVIGFTLQLGATITPSNATRQAISWTVEPGTGTATISAAGLLTATGVGTVTAIATNAASGVTGSKMITIISVLADAKTKAHAALTAELATFTQSDYTAENWTTLTGFKAAGDAAIDAATDLADVTSAKDAAISGMAGVQTIDETLAEAKAAALVVLSDELATYSASDYTAENWTTLTGFKAAGDAAIDAATDLAGVASAKDAAISGMAGVQTIAETLAAAKATAHTALTAELSTYTESDYTAENWTTLTGFKTAGDTAIDAATDLAGVTSAKAAAIAGMAGVQTIAETDLGSAINSAMINIGTAVVSADGSDVDTTDMWVSQSVMSAYSDAISAAQAVADNPGATQQQVDDALAAINSATDTFNAAKANGTNIPVIEINVTGETTVVIGFTLQLGATITPSNATRQAITWTVEPGTGTATISAAGLLTATGVGTVTVIATNAVSGVAGSKVITIISVLADAKTTAHAALTTELTTYAQTDYTAENWTTLTGLKTAGDAAIDAATDLADVTSAKDAAIAGMEAVETIAETSTTAKTTAHAALTTELTTYAQSDYTAENWTTLTGFKTAGDTAIDAATDLADVTSAKDAAIAGMEGVETIAETLTTAKTTAHAALTTELITYAQTDYTAENWTTLTGFKTAGDAAIDAATDLADVTPAKDAAIAGMADVQTIDETLTEAKAAEAALVPENYIDYSSVTAALTLPETTNAEKITKANAINAAIAALVLLT